MSDWKSRATPVQADWRSRAAAVQETAPPQPPAAPPTQGQKFMMGVGDAQKGMGQSMLHSGLPEGYVDMGMAEAQRAGEQQQAAIPAYDQGIQQREAAWQDRRKASGDTGVEWTRGLGNAAATAPLAAMIPGGEGFVGGMASGAAQGALSGSSQPVTSGDFAREKTAQTSLGAGFGGLTGGVLGAVGGKQPVQQQGSSVSTVPRAVAAQTQEEVRQASKAAYKASEAAGVIVRPDSFAQFVAELPTKLDGFRPRTAPKTAAVLEEFTADAASGKPITLELLDELRQIARSAADSTDRNEIRLGRSVIDHLDDFIDNIDGKHLLAGDAEKGVAALNEARSLWKTNAKLRNINDIVEIGENLNDPNWVKNQFRAIVRKPKQFNSYTADEQKLITDVARTGNLERLAKIQPFRGIQMAAPYVTQIGQDRAVGALQNTIARGGIEPPSRASSFLSRPGVRAAAEVGQRTLPYVAGRAAQGLVFGQ